MSAVRGAEARLTPAGLTILLTLLYLDDTSHYLCNGVPGPLTLPAIDPVIYVRIMTLATFFT
jgi:hypothetical protein